MWYTRSEALRRYSIFFSSTTLAGAFGSLIASGIATMQGDSGYAGWRWIFIIEGAVTATIAVVAFFITPNFVDDATWLSDDEKHNLQTHIESDNEDINGKEDSRSYKQALTAYFTDYKSYVAGALYFGMPHPNA